MKDNVRRAGVTPWPPKALLRPVRGYVARPSHFHAPDAEALGAALGRISKFQSVSSEGAVTFSWFGTLASAPVEARRHAIQWLYARAGLDAIAANPVIDQWVRVPHPNAPGSPNGPELDARIADTGFALIYVEAKWHAGIGKGKGKSSGISDDQVVLRRDALRASKAAADDAVLRAVLGISESVPNLSDWAEGDTTERPVAVRWLTWGDLAACPFHPAGDEFAR